MTLNILGRFADAATSTERMPVLFLGHGSPMNALDDNVFTRGFEKVSREMPRPTAILCISAHWETRGTFVTAMEQPRTIHDFGGFPRELFEVQYPAPGSPELALETQREVRGTEVGLDYSWGLDHGCWSVVKHLYPDASVPVFEMSIDYTQPPAYHYALGKELAALRRKGVLIVGSGNTVHNLRMAAWNRLGESFGYDWAVEANEKMKAMVVSGDHEGLVRYDQQGKAFQLAIPTPEHYIPLLYTLGLQEKDEAPTLFNDGLLAGSLNMLSVKIDGRK